MDLDGSRDRSFREKSRSDIGWINGGFMVLHPKMMDYIDGDFLMFEKKHWNS